MLNTEMEQKAVAKAGKNEGRKFIKAVRARFKDSEVIDLPKYGLVKAVTGLFSWSSQTENFYEHGPIGK